MAIPNPNLAYNWVLMTTGPDYSDYRFDTTTEGVAKPIMGVYCKTAGSATLLDAAGGTAVFTGLLAGVIYPLCPVKQTAGDAVLIALYSK